MRSWALGINDGRWHCRKRIIKHYNPIRQHWSNLEWNLPTTSTKPTCVSMGLLFTWHMYRPASSGWAPLRWSVQLLRCSSWLVLYRGILVTMWLEMATIILRSRWNHATFDVSKIEIVNTYTLITTHTHTHTHNRAGEGKLKKKELEIV